MLDLTNRKWLVQRLEMLESMNTLKGAHEIATVTMGKFWSLLRLNVYWTVLFDMKKEAGEVNPREKLVESVTTYRHSISADQSQSPSKVSL